MRVAESVKCMHLKAPYEHAIHCPPVESEFEPSSVCIIAGGTQTGNPGVFRGRLHPVGNGIPQHRAQFRAHADPCGGFPAAGGTGYADGARVFIELGAGSNCSKWVDAILKDRPHASMTINQNNVSDNVSILKLLARLIGQRVPLDLSVLSAVEQEIN